MTHKTALPSEVERIKKQNENLLGEQLRRDFSFDHYKSRV